MSGRSSSRKVAAFLLVLAAGATLGYVAGILLKPALAGLPKPSPLLLLGAVAFWTVGGIALHELGHVFGGLAAGFRFVLYTVGPLRVAREADGVRPGLNRAINLAGGVALMVPPTGSASPGALALFIAGGPVASLLSGLLAGVGAAATSPQGTLFPVLVIGAAVNLGLGLVTILPSHFGGFDSDGRQLFDLWKGGRVGELKLLLRSLTTASILGARPRQWDRAQLERLMTLAAGETGRTALVSHLLHYYYLLDTGDRPGAHAALTRALASQADAHPMLGAPLLLEQAWLATLDGDARAARDFLSRALANGRFLERYSRARVEAALLQLEGQRDLARAKVQEGLAHLPRALDRGGAALEREWLESTVGAA